MGHFDVKIDGVTYTATVKVNGKEYSNDLDEKIEKITKQLINEMKSANPQSFKNKDVIVLSSKGLEVEPNPPIAYPTEKKQIKVNDLEDNITFESVNALWGKIEELLRPQQEDTSITLKKKSLIRQNSSSVMSDGINDYDKKNTHLNILEHLPDDLQIAPNDSGDEVKIELFINFNKYDEDHLKELYRAILNQLTGNPVDENIFDSAQNPDWLNDLINAVFRGKSAKEKARDRALATGAAEAYSSLSHDEINAIKTII